jgi:thiol:disulfide interchange protein DsbD
MPRLFLLCLAAILLPHGVISLRADEALPAAHPVKAELLADTTAIVPGKTFSAGLLLRMEPGWHTYHREPGDSGLATSIEWQLPDGFSAGEIQWPKPTPHVESGDLRVNIYENEVLLSVTITPPAQLPQGGVTLRATAKWLTCKEACIPGSADLALTLPVAASAEAANAELFAKHRAQPDTAPRDEISRPAPSQEMSTGAGVAGPPLSLARALWLALLGGLILNIMPCVLPVISLKVLGFVQQGGEHPGRVRLLGLTYAAGVIASFAVLAGIAIAVQKAGGLASWGMQFQDPRALVVIASVILLVALNLFGVFEVALGGSAMNTAADLSSRGGFSGAFFHGMLTVVLATACTAPFLGAALGFAVFQPPHVIMLMFVAIGAGLALPYVVLSFFPALLRFLPQPGAWMEKFKVAMGFPMLATVVWLFDVAFGFYGGKVLWLGIFFVVLAFAAWVYGEFAQRSRKHPAIAALLALLLVAAGCALALEHELDWRHPPAPSTGTRLAQSADGIAWQPWSAAAVDEARRAGRPVFVDFTADWCVTCQTNKRTSIEIPSVIAKLKATNAAALLGDFTRGDPAIAAELRKYRRAGVPLVIVFPSDPQAAPVVLPELLTPSLVLDALEKAGH